MQRQGKMATKRVLAESQIFSALDDAELEEIARLAVAKEYQAGTTIFQEGDSAEELFVLEEGKVAVQMPLAMGQAQPGRRVTVDIVTRNEVLGWSAVVEPYVYTRTAVCLQHTRALSITGVRLMSLLRANHRIGYEVLNGLIKVVASRLDETRHALVSERMPAPKVN
jgi:CRP-like cAMP-binding protein